MNMSEANKVRFILNKIDQYKKYLKDMQNCTKLTVTIHDEYNGTLCTFERNSIEVEAIIKAYEEKIMDLEQQIAYF